MIKVNGSSSLIMYLIIRFIYYAGISLATILLLAICYDGLPLVEASLGMAFFMLCAQIAHIKVKNPLIKYVPSFIFLVLSLFIAAFNYGVI